jgi:hypothetical protein
MKRFTQNLLILSVALITLTACGGGSSDNGNDGGEPATLPSAKVENIRISVPENTTGSYDADDYIANATSFRFTDTDGSPETVVSADGKQFSAPDLNITLSGSIVSYVAGSVPAATTYSFGLKGLDDEGHSLELDAAVEITDVAQLTALVDNIQVSAVENTAGSYDAGGYIANAASFRMADTDGNLTTVVSADGKLFSAPDLNITISDSNISFVAGNVETVTAYSFALVGLDDDGHSLELNATFEITDETDDAAVELTDIEVPTLVTPLMSEFTVQAVATDPDGMVEVTVELSKAGTLIDTRYAYPDANLSRIDVNETFGSPGEGNYTVTFTALGIDGGEGNRSVTTVSRSLLVTSESVSSPTIAMLDQAVDDQGGLLPTVLPAPTVTDVQLGALYSIVGNPAPLKITINPLTGVITWLGNVDDPTDYSVTIRVENLDGGHAETTFNLHVNDTFLEPSSPTIEMLDQTVDDHGGLLPAILPAPTVTGVQVGAIYSIVDNPAPLQIIMEPLTGLITWLGNVNAPTDYSVTIRVQNLDGGNAETTFNLHINDTGLL